MNYKCYLQRNTDLTKAKGDIPYWVIADRIGVHENTLRNWMKKELDLKKRTLFLNAVNEIKAEINSLEEVWV